MLCCAGKVRQKSQQRLMETGFCDWLKNWTDLQDIHKAADGNTDLLDIWATFGWKHTHCQMNGDQIFSSSSVWWNCCIFFLEPPKFTRTPARVSVVRPGQSKVFECQVTGTPEIDIYWFREGSEITPTDRYKMVFVNSVATLEVCGADTKDSGLYYCEARNEAGSESCSMELKVKG